jgi:predicted ribosomally synthesized peptide with nif11-like leader
MNNEDLNNPELQEKLKACKSQEDLVKLAKEGGVELTEEQLNKVAGGEGWVECPEYEPCSAHFDGYR